MSRLIDAEDLKRIMCIKFYTTPYFKHILDEIDNAPTVTDSKQTGKWIDAEFEGRGIYNTPIGTTDGNITIHGFRCNNCRIFSHSKDRYCSHCGFFMTNYI